MITTRSLQSALVFNGPHPMNVPGGSSPIPYSDCKDVSNMLIVWGGLVDVCPMRSIFIQASFYLIMFLEFWLAGWLAGWLVHTSIKKYAFLKGEGAHETKYIF